MKRDWSQARAKVDREGRCRVCEATGGLDAAHLIPRSRVGPPEGEHPRNIVPLCRTCHEGFDLRGTDLLPFLTLAEQGFAAGLVGLVEAVERLGGRRVRPSGPKEQR